MSRLRHLALWLTLLAAAPAWAAPPAPPETSQPDPLKAPYEALPPADRRALQAALGWTGDFNGAVAGNYGPRTRDALTAYAARLGMPAPALLAPAGRARLLAAADTARRAIGFAPVRDPRAGFAIGVPGKLLPNRTALPNGTRYAAPDGATTLDVVGRGAGPGGLADMFARLTRDAPERRVTYKVARPDFIVVVGETADRRFYSRYAIGKGPAGDELVRGFVLTYPATSSEMDRVALAVAASFDPFLPDLTQTAPASVPTTASTAAPTSAPTTVPVAGVTPTVLSGEALLVAPGMALTRIARDRCPEAEIGGAPAAWSRQDPASGLALLSIPDRREVRPVSVSTDAVPGARYALFLPGDGLALAVAGGSSDGRDRIRLPLQAADAGVVVLDGAGRLAGLTGSRRTRPVSVGGVMAASPYDLAGPAELAGFLAANAVPIARDGGPALSLTGAASRWRPLIVPLRCRTKGAGTP